MIDIAEFQRLLKHLNERYGRLARSQEAASRVRDLLPNSLRDVLFATKWLEPYRSEKQLLDDLEGVKRLAEIGIIDKNALAEIAEGVTSWKKHIKAARATIKKNGWSYNEDSKSYERKTGGRRKELITECVHSMLDVIPHTKPDGTKIDEADVKDFVWKIFCFFFPEEQILARDSKVTNALKSYRQRKREKSTKKYR